MSLYRDLIREKDLRDKAIQQAADRLLIDGVYSEDIADDLSPVQAALQYIISAFGVSAGQVLGCANADELIVQKHIDGLFTGRAAWDATKFDLLIRQALKAYKRKDD